MSSISVSLSDSTNSLKAKMSFEFPFLAIQWSKFLNPSHPNTLCSVQHQARQMRFYQHNIFPDFEEKKLFFCQPVRGDPWLRESQRESSQICFRRKLCRVGNIVKLFWVSSTAMREPVEKVANDCRREPGVKVNSNPDDDYDEQWRWWGWDWNGNDDIHKMLLLRRYSMSAFPRMICNKINCAIRISAPLYHWYSYQTLKLLCIYKRLTCLKGCHLQPRKDMQHHRSCRNLIFWMMIMKNTDISQVQKTTSEIR